MATGGKAAGPVRMGKHRGERGTRVEWQVRAYGSTPSYPRGYVQYKSPETGKWLVSRPTKQESLDECFDRVETAVDNSVTLAVKSDNGRARNMTALIERYAEFLEGKGDDSSYIYGRKAMADLWITRLKLPDGRMFGDVLVAEWTTEHSKEVIKQARAAVGAARVEDIGSLLSGLRKVAWRRCGPARVRWLSPDENPLEDVSYTKAATHREVPNAHFSYIPPRLRPTSEMVLAAMALAPKVASTLHVGGEEWAELLLGVAGFCGPRQAEQLALRADDVDLHERLLIINGRWKSPRNGEPYYRQAFTKTDEIRVVTYDDRVHALLARRVPEARREAAERAAAARFAGASADHVALVGTAWLFPHAVHGVPPTKEQINTWWLAVRQALEEAGTDWPRAIKYRNFRHHFATWANGDRNLDWEIVAMLMGDDAETVKKHYVLPGADALEKARQAMRGM